MKRILAAFFLVAATATAQSPSPTPSPSGSLSLSISPTPTPAVDPIQQVRLAETQARIEEMQQRISNSAEKEAALLAALDETGEQIASLAEDGAQLRARLKSIRDQSEAHRASMDAIRERITKRKRWLSGRLRSIYVHGRPGWLRILFASESYGDVLRRSKFQSIIAKRDATMVAELKKDFDQVALERVDYERDLTLLEEMESEARVQGEELALERQFRSSLLSSVQAERMDFQKMRSALEAAADSLTKQVGALAGGATPEIRRPFADLKGRLLPPVTGVKVTLPFGPYRHPKLGLPMVHQGVKYGAVVGTDVRGVADGRVELAKWFSSYGLVVIVDHGDGWRTLYAHNGKLLKVAGDAVREGEVIATSGDTGSLEGPELYFAIYREGKAVDPAEWLLR